MPYITVPVSQKFHQISFDDILNGMNESVFERQMEDTHDTKTVFRNSTPQRLLDATDFDKMIASLEKFNGKYTTLINTEDKSTLYRSFKIPKRSGGLRQINAPLDELMGALRELKYLFEKQLYASYHTAAFAYVKGRNTIDAVKRHQRNKSRWFLKLDFHDFFGSSKPEFIIAQLETIFPFNEIVIRPNGREALTKALSICYLNNGLPQGTPISPTLTNLFMIPIDHYIAKTVREMTPHLVYTRYADDIILSSDLAFNWREVQDTIVDIVANKFHAPFSLNTAKTRYGSSAGRNWNLGVMLNSDNQITIGHSKKKVFKAMLFSFMNDEKNGNIWSLEDTQHLQGLISYYRMVEGATIDTIIKSYSTKFNKDVEQTIKDVLRAG